MAVGGWRLAVGGWQLVIGGGWQLAVGSRWRMAVGGLWRLANGLTVLQQRLCNTHTHVGNRKNKSKSTRKAVGVNSSGAAGLP